MAFKVEDFTNLSGTFMAQAMTTFLASAPAKTPINISICCGTAAFYGFILYSE